jgi:hypothetical protein
LLFLADAQARPMSGRVDGDDENPDRTPPAKEKGGSSDGADASSFETGLHFDVDDKPRTVQLFSESKGFGDREIKGEGKHASR